MKKIIITFFILIINLTLVNQTNAFTLDFEQTDYNYYGWNTGNDTTGDNWKRSTSQKFNGSYSLKAGLNGDHGNISCFQVREYFYTSGWIKFNYKVSSEANYDYLRFYRNGSEKNKWSGNVGWNDYSYNVGSGWNIFRWCYTKNGSDSNGDDTARIDNIRFQGVDCNPTWGNGSWSQTYSCRFKYSKKLYGNIYLYNSTIDMVSGVNMGIDLANKKIGFYEDWNYGTSSIPSKITIPTNSKIDNSTSGRYYESYTYNSSSGFSSCPAGMHVLKMDRSDYQSSSPSAEIETSGTYYCGY